MNGWNGSSAAEFAKSTDSQPDLAAMARLVDGVIGNLKTQADVNMTITQRLMALETSVKQNMAAMRATVPGPVVPPIYVGDHTVMTRVLNRYKMYVDTRDLDLTPTLILDGSWEPPMAAVFLSLIRPGMTVVDVGANVGFYTLLAADAVGDAGKVISVEPDARNFELLNKNIEVNGFNSRVGSHQAAAVDSPRTVQLFRFLDRYGCHSLVDRQVSESVQVPGITLDSLVPGTADLLKIDAEGAEPSIWEGMRNLLRRGSKVKILMEFFPGLISANSSPGEFLRRIEADGFRITMVTLEGKTMACSHEFLLNSVLSNLLLERKTA